VLSRGLAAGVVLVALVFGLVAQSNEREMRRRLDAASESLRQSKAAYVHAETGRLNELATLELRHEPAATLRHAAASFELAHDPALDVLAWHARSLGVSVSLPGLSGPVTSVSVAPHWIAAASGDAAVVLARAATDHVLLDLKDGGAGRITALAFSPDGGALAIGRGSGDVSLGRAPTFAMGGSWHCEGGVEELAWPTGESLSAVCRAGTEARSTLTIDVPAGQSRVAPMPPVPAPRRQGAALLVSSEGPGASLAIDENHMAELRAPGLARAFEAEVAAPAFAWVPARHAAALVARTGEVLVVSLATLGVVARLESPRHEIVSLAADPQGEWIVAGATDGAVQAFDLEQAAVVVTQGRLDPPPVCGLSPDGSAVACASADSLAVRVVERSSGVARPPSRTSAPAAVDAIGLGSDGRSVFTLAGGELRRDGRLVPGLSGVTKLSVADGHVALALVDAAGHAALAVGPLDLEAAPAPSSLPAAITALAWGAHGSRLLVATADRRVRVFSPSPAGAVELDSLDVPSPAAISAVAGADEGEKIVVGTEAGDVFFTASRSDPLRRVASLHAPIGCLSVAEGGRAVVASADRTAFVVDGDTGLSFALGTSSSPVAACSRSPAEDRFSFVDRDGTTWLKALDLADVGASYVPADPADVPTLAAWKGLPVGLGR
jgi:WD40 repeat protein